MIEYIRTAIQNGATGRKFGPKQQEILLYRFGFKTGYCMSLQAVAKAAGCSREHVRNAEAKLLRSLEWKPDMATV